MNIFRSLLFLSTVFIAGCTDAQTSSESIVKNVKAQEFKTIIDEGTGQLIDLRTPSEFQAGHIEGAVMIDYYAPDFKENLDTLDKNKPVIIYCRSGNRSSRSITLLQQLGFKEIVNLEYGIKDWSRAGYQFVQ